MRKTTDLKNYFIMAAFILVILLWGLSAFYPIPWFVIIAPVAFPFALTFLWVIGVFIYITYRIWKDDRLS